MPTGYKNYDAKTKAKIALAGLKEEESLLGTCPENKIGRAARSSGVIRLISLIFMPVHEHQKACQKLKIDSLHRVQKETVAQNNFFKDSRSLDSKHFKEPGRKPSGEVEGAYTAVRD